jgi:hypothetical protein
MRARAHRRTRPSRRCSTSTAIEWWIARTACIGFASALVALGTPTGFASASTGQTSSLASNRPALGDTTARTVSLSVSVAPFALPEPVSRPVALADRGTILLLGGLHAGDVSTDDIVRVDPAHARASVVGTLAIAVHDAGGVQLGANAFVFAGGAATTQTAVQAWAGSRTSIIGALPQGRSDLVGAAVGGVGYVIGGFDGTALVPQILATRDGRHFSVVGRLVQPVRYPAVSVVGGKILVIGGALSTTEGTLAGPQTSDIQRFDPASGVTTIIGHLPHVLSHAMALTIGNDLYVIGGREGATLSSDIWKVNPATGAVLRVGTFAMPRSDAGAVVVNGTGYLLGGEVSGPDAPLSSIVVVKTTP